MFEYFCYRLANLTFFFSASKHFKFFFVIYVFFLLRQSQTAPCGTIRKGLFYMLPLKGDGGSYC